MYLLFLLAPWSEFGGRPSVVFAGLGLLILEVGEEEKEKVSGGAEKGVLAGVPLSLLHHGWLSFGFLQISDPLVLDKLTGKDQTYLVGL